MVEFMLGLLLASAQPDVDLARRTLSQALGVREDLIQLRSSRRGRWFDSSLGCSSNADKTPGVFRGVEVLLKVDGRGGRDYAVHVAGQRAVVCATADEEQKPAIAPAAQKLNQLAREDLAARLQISDQEIETRSVQSTVWPDSSLGCPRPGLSYAQMMTPGYLIELQAKGKTWSYHSDLRRAIACDTVGAIRRLGPGIGPPAPGAGPVDK